MIGMEDIIGCRARCSIAFAHLLRDMNDLEQEFETHEEVKNYTSQMKLNTGGRDATGENEG